MRVAVLFSYSKRQEQQDNKLISPQEVKLCCGIRDYLTSIFIRMHPSLWLMDFVQIFREVPGYVQWFTLGVSHFYVKRKQNKNHLYPHTATLDFCIVTTTTTTDVLGPQIIETQFNDFSDR